MMNRILIVAAMVALLVSSAQAADRKGELALGFNNSDAPVGLRYFVSDAVAVDFGVGFESLDLGDESSSSLWLEFGVPYVVFDYEDSFFFVRPAVTYSSLDDRIYGSGELDETWTILDFSLNLGAEVRLADRFGLTFQHGLVMTTVDPAGGGDSLTDFGTFGENVTEAGVWFTF